MSTILGRIRCRECGEIVMLIERGYRSDGAGTPELIAEIWPGCDPVKGLWERTRSRTKTWNRHMEPAPMADPRRPRPTGRYPIWAKSRRRACPRCGRSIVLGDRDLANALDRWDAGSSNTLRI